jgi:hypothetical protein
MGRRWARGHGSRPFLRAAGARGCGREGGWGPRGQGDPAGRGGGGDTIGGAHTGRACRRVAEKTGVGAHRAAGGAAGRLQMGGQERESERAAAGCAGVGAGAVARGKTSPAARAAAGRERGGRGAGAREGRGRPPGRAAGLLGRAAGAAAGGSLQPADDRLGERRRRAAAADVGREDGGVAAGVDIQHGGLQPLRGGGRAGWVGGGWQTGGLGPARGRGGQAGPRRGLEPRAAACAPYAPTCR